MAIRTDKDKFGVEGKGKGFFKMFQIGNHVVRGMGLA